MRRIQNRQAEALTFVSKRPVIIIVKSYGRKFCALVLVLAVLVVGVTCTSAGCLLHEWFAASGGGTVRTCCEGRTDQQGDSRHQGHKGEPKNCPLCQQSVSIGKMAEKSSTSFSVHAPSAPLLANSDILSAATMQDVGLRNLELARPSSHIPSTLLALHCALLT